MAYFQSDCDYQKRLVADHLIKCEQLRQDLAEKSEKLGKADEELKTLRAKLMESEGQNGKLEEEIANNIRNIENLEREVTQLESLVSYLPIFR